jgi:hypothetical protein
MAANFPPTLNPGFEPNGQDLTSGGRDFAADINQAFS